MDPPPPADKVDPDECTASGEPKACADCHTTKTPLWRGGPTGPKSLCNACGIRYRKRRRQALGLDATETEGAEQQQQHRKKAKKENKEDEVTVELHMVGFGKDVVLKQRRRMRRRKCLGEEERAAILLMALSSGVIYA